MDIVMDIVEYRRSYAHITTVGSGPVAGLPSASPGRPSHHPQGPHSDLMLGMGRGCRRLDASEDGTASTSLGVAPLGYQGY